MTPQSARPRRSIRSRSLGAALLASVMLVGLLPGAVLAAAATKLVLTSAPSSEVSGQAMNVTLQAQDSSNNVDTNFTGTVNFSSSDGSASVSPGTPYTFTNGDNGTKTFSVTLRSFGTQSYTFASSGLSSAIRTITVSASRVVFTVAPGGGATGAAWPTQPDVEIRDETGARVTTSSASISLAIGSNPSGGVLSGCSNLTASAGLVNVAGCKIDKAGNGYTLVASSSGLISATSGAFNITSGTATKLGFAVQPARGTPGGAFAVQPVVEIQDSAGSRVAGDSSTNVTLSITSNPGGGTLTCSGGLTRQASNGLASFTGCSINNVGVGYVLTATASGVSSAASSAFDVADRLIFATQPSSSAGAGISFGTQPVVQVRAGGGNTATHDQATVVTLSIKSGTGAAGAVLTCDSGLSRTVVNGVATFTGCKINKISPTSPSNPYRIVASASGVAGAESSNIAITAGGATKLGFIAQPNAGVAAQAFPIQPVVAIQDAGGNTVTSGPNSNATITLSLAPGAPAGAILTCTNGRSMAASSGVATFAGCSINAAGTYSLVATATGGLTAITGTPFVVTAPGASITLTNSASVITWGSAVGLTIQFGANGANKTFVLEGARDGVSWSPIATLKTNSSNQATYAYRPATNLFYRARFVGTPDLAAATSNTTRTVVRQIALLRPTNYGVIKSIARNTRITFTTTVRPSRPELAPAKVTFRLYHRVGRSWVFVTRREVYINSLGK
ncbi:MAG: trimeric autotransporter adhesin, partial [Chloroflexota bacterium]|nr:trimeric autotransporter adhesin [Chloroflexota bacterium]